MLPYYDKGAGDTQRLGLGSARLGSARPGPAQLGSAQPAPARLGTARLGHASARLGPPRLGSARLGYLNFPENSSARK